MKYKSLIVLGLLMFVALAGIFFYKGGNLLVSKRAEIINSLEEKYQVEFKTESVSLWPLNRIVLNNVEIKNDQVDINAKKALIYYDLYDLITKNNIINGFDYIKIKNPSIKIHNIQDDVNNKEDILIPLPYFKNGTEAVSVEIENGFLSYNDLDNKIQFQDLFMTLTNEKNQMKIKADTDVNIEKLKWNNHKINNVNINNLDLNLISSDNSWRGNLNTGYLALEQFHKILDQKIVTNEQFEAENFQGEGKFSLNFRGKNNQLDDYSGKVDLKHIQAKMKNSKLEHEFIVAGFNSEVSFDSRKLSFKNTDLLLNEIPFSLEGSYNFENKKQINVILDSRKFDLSQVNKFVKNYNFAGMGEITAGINGNITNPEVSLNFSLPSTIINSSQVSGETDLRYKNGLIYLDYFKMYSDMTGKVLASGIYNTDNSKYSFDLKSSRLNLGLLTDHLEVDFFEKLKPEGTVNLDTSIVGAGFSLDQLSLLGDIQIESPEINNTVLDHLKSRFYLSNGVLMVEKGQLEMPDKIDFAGIVDLNQSKLDLQVSGNNISVEKAARHFDNGNLSKLNGSLDINCQITDNITEPIVNITAETDEISWNQYNFTDFQIDSKYHQDNIEIVDASVNYKNSFITGSGSINLDKDFFSSSAVDGTVSIDNYQYSYIEEMFAEELPAEGSLQGDFNLGGNIDNPEVSGDLFSNNTIVEFENNKKMAFTGLGLKFEQMADETIIEKLQIYKGDSYLLADGKLVNWQELDLGYVVHNLQLGKLSLAEEVEGTVKSIGIVQGELKNPTVEGSINVDTLEYEDTELEKLSGDYRFNNNKLQLTELVWFSDDSKYNINGLLALEKGTIDLTMTTDNGQITDFPFLGLTNYPIPEGYYFKGKVGATGRIQEPVISTDLVLKSLEDKAAKLNIKGTIAEKLDLSFHGEKVELGKLPYIKRNMPGLTGNVDVEGSLTGRVESFNLELETNISQMKAGQDQIKKLQGIVNIQNATDLHLEQKMVFDEDRELTVNGSIPIEEGLNNLNLELVLTKTPIGIFSNYYSEVSEVEGFADGRLILKGPLKKPQAKGQVSLSKGEFGLNFPEKFTDLKGELIFNNDRIELEEASGKYGDGNLSLKGNIFPYSRENNWDLQANGQSLPFNYGSFNGRFDPDLKVSGTFTNPFITADILTHHLDVGIPIKWPASEESQVNHPGFDITLYPGEEVYLTDDSSNYNIKVPIEEGSLNITGDNQGNIQFSGLLESSQGSFDYYNNKFILEEGTADFSKNSDYIPIMDVQAATRIRGIRIETNLTGPANQMLTTFHSSTDMSDEEILSLLTSRGGLGALITGDWEDALGKEFSRLLLSQLQLGFVEDIQETIKEIFSLDRLELDTYNLGWNRQVSVHMGKYLSEDIYLEYTGQITPEGENDDQLALKYYFNDIFHLEGSWAGVDDLSIGLKTNFDF
ncbi:MAG: translocation/assembly module TamB domain-containing protein [Halothermotrichaceae bacterium]